MEQQELSSISAGIQNDMATLEDSLTVSFKMKHILTILSSNHAVENLSPHKNLHTGVFAALLVITQILKQPKYLSVGKWVSKLWSIQKWNIIQH